MIAKDWRLKLGTSDITTMHWFVSTTFRVLAKIGLNFNLKTVTIDV